MNLLIHCKKHSRRRPRPTLARWRRQVSRELTNPLQKAFSQAEQSHHICLMNLLIHCRKHSRRDNGPSSRTRQRHLSHESINPLQKAFSQKATAETCEMEEACASPTNESIEGVSIIDVARTRQATAAKPGPQRPLEQSNPKKNLVPIRWLASQRGIQPDAYDMKPSKSGK